MSSIPFTAFSAKSVHQVIRMQQCKQQEEGQLSGASSSLVLTEEPGKKPKIGEMYNYNLKFMKSVWGMYNQYAPQAFQKNEELAKHLA